jgi:hypothetical protein
MIQDTLERKMIEALLLRSLVAQDLTTANSLLLNQGANFSMRYFQSKLGRISDSTLQIISTIIARNETVISIDLSPQNEKGLISSQGCSFLSEALMKNKTVEELNLSYNPRIGEEGVQYIVQGLEQNNVLKLLCLNQCGVNDIAAEDLSRLLRVRQPSSSPPTPYRAFCPSPCSLMDAISS